MIPHPARHALAVVAHPDDESFGLGAVLATLASSGTTVSIVCFTHGEASTLGAEEHLGERRRSELEAAARALGVRDVTLLGHPDGALAAVAPGVIDAVVEEHLDGTDLLVAFDASGVTGHPDHRAATAAAFRAARRHGLAVLEWGVSPAVADALRRELGAPFVALDGDGACDVDVDRGAQLAAIACHASQATGNAVLARRLELQGPTERVRYVEAPRP